MSTTTSLSSTITGLLPWTEEEKQLLKWNAFSQNMPVGMCGFGATSIGNQFLLFGGRSDNSNYLSTAIALNVDTGIWSQLPPMPTARRQCAVVAVDDCAIVIGGRNDNCHLGSVEMVNVKTKKWTSLPSMPTPRDGCDAVVVGNQVIVMGGWGARGLLKTVEMYNFDTQEWTNLPPMSSARAFCSAAVVEEKVYVFGGEELTAEVFNIRTKEWITLVPMPFSHRYGAALTIGRHVVLIGGNDGTGKATDRVYTLDTETHEWSNLPPMNTKRCHCAAALVHDQIVVAAGHDEHQRNLNTAERMVVGVRLPTPPKIPPTPTVQGRRQRRTALEQWLEDAIAIKKEYLERVDSTSKSIDKNFQSKKAELENLLHLLEARNQRLVALLDRMKNDWLRDVDDRIEDNEDDLECLVASLDGMLPARRVMDAPRRPAGFGQEDPPTHLLCPITGRLMNDPVMAADGHTYERSAIEQHISQFPEEQDVWSPVTGDVLESRRVFPNKYICDQVRLHQD